MKINITGISGSRIAYYAAQEIEATDKVLILVSHARAAERLAEDLAFFVRKEILVMPEEEEIKVLYEARDMDSLIKRIKALDALVSPRACVVIAPVSAALRPLEPRERFLASTFTLSLGSRIAPEKLREKLVLAGYEPAQIADAPGLFSVRGGIVDLFPPTEGDPVRVEFFDDEIDSLRSYDRESQRSLENLSAVRVTPATEFMPTEDERRTALTRITEEYDARIARLEEEKQGQDIKDGRVARLKELRSRISEMFTEMTNLRVFSEYLHYFDEKTQYLWDYMDEGGVMVCDPARVVEAVPAFQRKEDFYRVYEKDAILFTPFPERIKGVDTLDHVVNVRSRQVAAFNGQMQLFAKETAELLRDGYEVHIVSAEPERLSRMREYMGEQGVYGKLFFTTGSLSAGMVLEEEKLCYISESDLFPHLGKSRKRNAPRKKKHVDFADLKTGDYVVHEEHGVGQFTGIATLTTDGESKDYLKIHYAGTDVLYIPTDQLDMIQRYIGNEGNAPKLSRLSGGDWRNTRARARRAIEEIAEDLVRLYAEREQQKGYAFSEDTVWQKEFEEAFPYTETDDQLKAIEEIKEDMQRPVPMDRLLCGDVGYGKTEVAARAIFKCVSEGKQAVLLAPTTLLANQHFHTLKERYQKFPFNIEMMSRFVTEEHQRKVVENLARGTVDLVVGTHRLFSADIRYHDLGLLVIDEEQRFGVKHKERLKMMRKEVDVLTLSATPIPRTLNMSLTGIKNISTIEEPPGDRYPVQTFVTPEDDALLVKIIRREFARGGQVFVVCNRVKGINAIAARIRELVPEARVGVGHGQMDETNLENVMVDFVEGTTNVLVATTIIENGIDISNANTIVILNADKLGLAQLYQLRGRVGRSNRLAYAYLMYQPQKVLSELARKRLAAIREFTEFGAGFRLAMRDLELRGAGNVLGEAQHGHISGIGYELYVKEIDRAVRRLNGEEITGNREEVAIEADIPARIPAEYISDESLKLQAYRRIAQIRSSEDAEDVVNELIDRYGDPPEITLDLVRVAETKCMAAKLGVETIALRGGRFVLTFAEKNKVGAYVLIAAKQRFGEDMVISGGHRPEVSLKQVRYKPAMRLLELVTVLWGAAEEEERRSKEAR